MIPAPAPPPIRGTVLSLGQVRYENAWDLQRTLVERRAAEQQPDTLVLLEHDPVFTIGRSGREDHWGGDERLLVQSGYPVYRIERGGSITFHGPGQIVGYPILRLASYCPGPKAYVRLLEEVLIRTVAHWGIMGRRIDTWPGVWVGSEEPAKIAAIGVKIQRGVTMHGFALNVTMDLSPFQLVTPCGIERCRVTSVAHVLRHDVRLDAVRRLIAEKFGEVFGIQWTDCVTDPAAMRQRWPPQKPVQVTRESGDESDE